MISAEALGILFIHVYRVSRSGKVAAARIWATSASGYSAMGATSACSWLALIGAASVGFPASPQEAPTGAWKPLSAGDETAARTNVSD